MPTGPKDSDAEIAVIKPDWIPAWDGVRTHTAEVPSYRLTRFFMLRLLGAVYLAAFVSLATQVSPLLGSDGFHPIDLYLERVYAQLGSRAYFELPTIFWLGVTDGALVALAWIGAGLSLVVLAGYANAILMFVLWALYSSFVHVGQVFYGYGWEIELLENGFLAIFLCPLFDGRAFPERPPPQPVIWMYRWLALRVMLGAGLIKLRGDPCWRDLTCLYYHYETQPIPNPISRYLHAMPGWFHQLGVLYNHLAELIAPLFVFGPRTARHLAGGVMIVFQLILVASGNLSFLNWLTMIPILACFDDGAFARIAPRRLLELTRARAEASLLLSPSRPRRIVIAALMLLISILSIEPALNLLSPNQAMNASFDPLDLVNTYGAFGSVGRTRDEIIFEGTRDQTITSSTAWVAYEFPCKPGDVERAPCITGPYQRRLDWQVWFAAMSGPADEPWTVHLVWKLLHNDRGALSLLANDPFPGEPPRFVRAELYRYEFAPPTEAGWWRRRRLGEWLPPLSGDDPRILEFLDSYGVRR